MANAGYIVSAALKAILVQGSEVDIQPYEFSDALGVLNDMMNTWDALGITLGYTEVSTVDDVLTVPVGSISGIVSNLAIYLAPRYGASVSPELSNIADIGLRAARNVSRVSIFTTYPSTLPIGSGNTGIYNRNIFYPEDPSQLDAEYRGPISLEDMA